jgi:hemoglobin
MPQGLNAIETPPLEPAISEADIAALVDAFYARARHDRVIGPVFADAVTDWPAHFATLRAFWSSIMLRSGRYKGNPFAMHMGKGIEPAFFDRWLTLWGETAADLLGPDKAALFMAKAERIAQSLKAGLFFAPLSIEKP